MNTYEADDIARVINQHNARRSARADAVAGLLVVLVVGVLLALALLHFATPCAAATLCSGALITPTRRGWWRRLRLALRARYLRVNLRAAEQDANYHAATADLAPQLERLARQRAAELRVELIDCEGAAR